MVLISSQALHQHQRVGGQKMSVSWKSRHFVTTQIQWVIKRYILSKFAFGLVTVENSWAPTGLFYVIVGDSWDTSGDYIDVNEPLQLIASKIFVVLTHFKPNVLNPSLSYLYGSSYIAMLTSHSLIFPIYLSLILVFSFLSNCRSAL